MALLTAQQISKYYELYQSTDVTFTKEVIQTVGLVTKNIFLKYLGVQLPCVISSCSMVGAKIIANVKSELFNEIRGSNNVLSLHFGFMLPGKSTPISFYVSSRVVGYSPYAGGSEGLNVVSLSYSQRPPDDLIGTLGQLIEATSNAKRRKEDRILITVESMRKLGLVSKDAILYVQGVPRKCIVRDLSFSGAKLIVTGIGKFLVDKETVLHLELEDKNQDLELAGRIIRFDPVEGRRDIAALAVQFDDSLLPLEYKVRINEFLTTVRQSPPDESRSGET